MTPFLGQIEIFSFGFAPKGWAQCNGQLLPINQNQALFSLLGTTYGGNGVQTFGLPNLNNAPLGTPPQNFTWCIGAGQEFEFPSRSGMTATKPKPKKK
jgi:microcystin-dependent protein